MQKLFAQLVVELILNKHLLIFRMWPISEY